jgi:iron complex outermembrane receptor protein
MRVKSIAVLAVASVLGFGALAHAEEPAAAPTAASGSAASATPMAPAQPYEQSVAVPQPAEPPPAPPPPDDTMQLEEVIVTARRTAENVQTVPVAISTMSADDLQREQINSPSDLNGKIPSLVINTGSQMRNTETPTVRGQGAQFGSSPGVVIYLAEVPLASDPVANYQGGPGKFFDLSSVQVLKGSQGTLFGRNTTGGALLLEPRKPQEGFSGSLRAGGMRLASEDSLRGQSYEAVVNVPIFAETLLARAGGQFYQRDGFTRDVVTGKDYDSKNYWTARVGLLWRVSDAVENYLMGHYADSEDHGTATVIERINREGLNRVIPAAAGLGLLSTLLPGIDLTQTANAGCLLLNVYGPSTNCGQDILDEQAARGVRRVQLDGDPNDILKSGGVVDKLSFNLSDTLTLVNIASYSTLEHSYRWDLDGSRAPFNQFTNPEDILEADVTTITEELQLQGKALGEALRYAVGGYYEATEAEGRIVGTSLLFIDVDQRHEQEKRSLAPFAQGTYDFGNLADSLSGLNLTLGARYTWDKTSGSAGFEQVASGGLPFQSKSFSTEVRNSALTYTAGLDYRFDTHLLYGKVSRGYKTGGISTIAVNPDHYTYAPEFVVNYELGQKSDFELGGIPVRVNSAVYYTDYTGLQKGAMDAYVDPNSPSPAPQLGQAIFNVGSASVAGFEADVTIRPLRGVTVMGTYGYTRAEYRDFSFVYRGATPQLDCSGEEVESGNTVDMACIPFQTTPEHQFSLTARYLLPFDYAVGDIEVSATYAWTDEQYSSPSSPPEGEPGAWLDAYGLLNASLSWERILGSSFTAQLFGTNLTDELYRISNSNQWNLTYIQSSIYSEPRVIGLQLGYRWGAQ